MEAPQLDAYAAFQSQLRTLCLNEFPCGPGKWRYDYTINPKQLTSDDKINSRFVITLKDHGANLEKIESLEELIKSRKSPWKLDYSWSDEAKNLRQIAVQTPWKIDDNFIQRYFKTLRILDKNVIDVDEQLLQFTNLEELSLSANNIVGVNSQYLPPNLKVLELCANQISDLSGLVIQPPPLVHLGLGLNRISFLCDYLSGVYWPSLLSLDLGHNDLTDLLDVIKKICCLPKLRNLVVQGNPLSLVPAYRGYTIDSLRSLAILDDVRISADEKHHYKGLARRKEFVVDEAKMFVELEYISGIPCPEEISCPENFPEYPKIERKYFVEFMFPEDTTRRVVSVYTVDTRPESVPQTESVPPTETAPPTESATSRVTSLVQESTSVNQESICHARSDGQSPMAIPSTKGSTRSETTQRDSPRRVSIAERPPTAITPSTNTTSDHSQHNKVILSPVRSRSLPWEGDIMEYHWCEALVRDDLITLRDFLMTPVTLSVIEEKVLAYPPEELSEKSDSPLDKKGKDDKKGKANNKKGKEEKGKDEKGKPKKKKKGEEEDLVRKPPEFSTLATFELSLETFLAGGYEVSQKFQKNLNSEDDDKKDKVEQKKRPASPKKKDTAKERENAKGSEKGKGKKDKGGDEDEESVIPPLEVKVTVKLHHWETAMDSVKEEESKNIESAPQ